MNVQADRLPRGAMATRTNQQEPTAPVGSWLSSRATMLALLAAVLAGAIVRGVHVLSADFPLNDGGMFFAMVQDLQAHHYGLPVFTEYNRAAIPFAYSPLGFYAAGVVDDWTPFSLVDLFRLLPWLYSSLTVAAFALLARRLLRAPVAVVAATFAFALTPRSFIWLLMGGGVTRGLGLLCALLALHEMHRLYTERDARAAIAAAVLCACTVLAHVETGWFLVFSIVIFWAVYGRSRATLWSSVAVAGTALALTAPWWLAVLTQHGARPFLEANASGGNVFSSSAIAGETLRALLRVTATSEPFFPLIGALGVVGALAAIRARAFGIPVWWCAIILLDLRAYPTFTSVPVALLAGLAVSDVLLPLVQRVAESNQGWIHELFGEGVPRASWIRRSGGVAVLVGVLLLYATAGALVRAPGLSGEGHYLAALTQPERDTLGWISRNTPDDSRFLVMPRGPWQVDREAEWFPVLAQRQSVGTVQGSEWTGQFEAAVAAHDAAWGCGYRVADCLVRWTVEHDRPFTHVYVPRDEHGQCCETLVEALRRSPAYVLLFDGAGGTVFAQTGVPGGSVAADVIPAGS